MRTIAILAVLSFLACNGSEPPPPPPPELCNVWSAPGRCVCPPDAPLSEVLKVCAPPRVDRPVDWGAVRGVTAFSLALRDVKLIADFTYQIHEQGWTTLRVGAQTTHDWCTPRAYNMLGMIIERDGSRAAEHLAETDLLFSMAGAGYLPCGPFHGTQEWRENLVRMLDVTARIPNTWIQLIPTFTYKSHDEGGQAENVRYFSRMFDRVNAVVKEGNYKHVVWEMFNEPVHPLSQHLKDEDVEAIAVHAQENTDLPVCAGDFHGEFRGEEPWPGRYPFIWRQVSDYFALHPRRNPEPDYAAIRAAQDRWNYPINRMWADETVAWASNVSIAAYNLQGKGTIAELGYGTEESRMLQVIKHLRDLHRVGWKPFYHSIWGIQCLQVGRIPNYDKDIRR